MCGSGVRETCSQRAIDVVKTSAYEHGLGVRYIWQIEQGGTSGELEGTEANDGVVCSSARRKELNFTCRMRGLGLV